MLRFKKMMMIYKRRKSKNAFKNGCMNDFTDEMVHLCRILKSKGNY